LPAPEPDYRNYDRAAEEAREEAHKAQIKAWMVGQGYTGPLTGEIVRFSVADGHALYMMADGKKGSFLIHLPYGDGYHYQHIVHLPKAVIVKTIETTKRLDAMFSKLPSMPKPAAG
jgi:hypothetical protein